MTDPARSATLYPLTSESVALAFAGVPYAGTPEHVAWSCVEAVRALAGGAHLRIGRAPVPLSLGDPPEALIPAFRFPALDGEGELWTRMELGHGVAQALRSHLTRIWSAQQERASLIREMERLQFHLGALQQVARTLSLMRGVEETERIVLDFVREMFFAWWGALYLPGDGGEYVCRVDRSLRNDVIPVILPAAVVEGEFGTGGAPFALEPRAGLAQLLPADAAIVAPLDLGEGERGMLVLGSRMNEQPFDSGDLALLRAVADSSATALRNAHLLERVRSQASIDPLTGCLNRRGFDESLEMEIVRCRRYSRPFSLVLLDLDHFKQLNDQWGHAVGDEALKRVGEMLNKTLRATDRVCRYGGEEFALLLPETTKLDGAKLAERIRRTLSSLPLDAALPRRLTASFGVASLPEDAPHGTELLRSADKALYRAKQGGRDCVRIAKGEDA